MAPRNALELPPEKAAVVLRARRLDARYAKLAEVARETLCYLDRLAAAFEPPVEAIEGRTIRAVEESLEARKEEIRKRAHEALRTINFAGLYRDRLLEALGDEGEEEA